MEASQQLLKQMLEKQDEMAGDLKIIGLRLRLAENRPDSLDNYFLSKKTGWHVQDRPAARMDATFSRIDEKLERLSLQLDMANEKLDRLSLEMKSFAKEAERDLKALQDGQKTILRLLQS